MELKLPTTLSRSAVLELHAQVRAARGPIVLTGESRGLDLEGLEASGFDPLSVGLRDYHALLCTLAELPYPILAHVRGQIVGGGVGLVAAADVVVADPATRFSLPEIVLGLVPSSLMPTLARRVGAARARFMALTGPIGAEHALQIGLVDIVSEGREVNNILRRWRRASPEAIARLRGPTEPPWADCETLIPRAEGRIRNFLDGLAPWEMP